MEHVTDDPRASVLTIGTSVASHKTLNAPGEAVKFTAALNGFPAVEGTLRPGNGSVHIYLKVEDSQISPHATSPWEGSCIEIFTAAGDGAPIRQICLQPQPAGSEARVLYCAPGKQVHPLPGAEAQQTIHGTSYEIETTLTYEQLSLPADAKEFLFDAIFRLTSLGDAHSGGRTSLNESFESNKRSEHYRRVVV
jgi:hypothetical protein